MGKLLNPLECGFSHCISRWYNYFPSIGLQKIADYFNVSVGFLLGRYEPTQAPTNTNKIKTIARGGNLIEFEYNDEELQTILKMLELTKKD